MLPHQNHTSAFYRLETEGHTAPSGGIPFGLSLLPEPCRSRANLSSCYIAIDYSLDEEPRVCGIDPGVPKRVDPPQIETPRLSVLIHCYQTSYRQQCHEGPTGHVSECTRVPYWHCHPCEFPHFPLRNLLTSYWITELDVPFWHIAPRRTITAEAS